MFGLRLASLAVATILLVTANASPIPRTPKLHEVIWIRPDRTQNGVINTHNGNGATTSHPHINIGPVPGQPQNFYLLQTSSHPPNGFNPSVVAPRPLIGRTRVVPAIAHAKNIQKDKNGVQKISAQNMVPLYQAALTEAHENAERKHSLAAQAHRQQELFHLNQAARLHQSGDPGEANKHILKSGHHRDYALHHEHISAHHHQAATLVNAPNTAALHQALHHALSSAQHAEDAHRLLTKAQMKSKKAQRHRQAANKASEASLAHHNR